MPVVETMAGMYVISSLSSLVSSALNTWSSHKNRQSSERISALSRDSSEEVARLSREHSAKLQYNQLKFSVLQQRENQDFQKELAELSHGRLKEIEAYRAEVNFAINQKNLDFQKWSFEQRKIIEYDILQLQQNFQRDLSQIQHQNALIQMRERMRADKSPINNLACDLLENSFSHGIMPLKVFLAPPILDYDPSTGKPYNDSYEGFLAKEIEQFLHQGYLNSKQYPVQLLDGSWVSKKQGGGSALQSIHAQLKSIPVLILESKIPLGELNLSLGYWNSGDTSYTQASILSGVSFSDLLRSLVKQRALKWEVTRKKLEASGKDEAYIKTMGGVNEENLQVYYKELAEKTELESLGIDDIDTSNLPISKQYKTTETDYKSFYQYLAVWHCLVIGLYADILFLGNSWENTPLLPSLIPYLLEKYKNHFLLTPQFWQEAISKIVTTYGEFYDSLKSDASSCLPEIRMKLALSLANLPNEYKYLALKQCDRAVTDWLVANNVPSDKIFDMDDDDDIQLLKGIFYQEDKPFLDSIKQLLVIVNQAKNIDLSKLKTINSLLDGWKLLSRFGSIPALPQVKVEVKPIISAVEAFEPDFRKLEQLLNAGEWVEADEETTQLMLKCGNREEQTWLDIDSYRNFPQEELRIIDQLWLKYSQNRFGLSVQKKIWLENGGELDGNGNYYDYWDTFMKLYNKVGWENGKSKLYYSEYALHLIPVGHFPASWMVGKDGFCDMVQLWGAALSLDRIREEVLDFVPLFFKL